MKTVARILALLAFSLCAFAGAARAEAYLTNTPPLIDRLTPEVLAVVYPDAGRLEPVAGPPTAVAVYGADDTTIVGYIFSTLDIVHAHGFSTLPFDVLAGITTTGTITGAKMVFQRDPHIDGDNRAIANAGTFLSSLGGLAFNRLSGGPRDPSIVTGATISARAMRAAIGDSSRIVMRGLVGLPEVTVPTLDVDGFATESVDELIADGSIVSHIITNGEVQSALDAAGMSDLRLDTPLRGEPGDTYIDLRIGLGTPASIGRNAIPNNGLYDLITSYYPAGSQAIIIGSEGRYNYQGIAYQNASSGGVLDRIEIRQGTNDWTFTRTDFMRGGPGNFGLYSGFLILGPETGFQPLQPWSAVLKVNGKDADGNIHSVDFAVDYTLPASHILMPEPPPEPLWVGTWRDAVPQLIVLGLALTVLTLIFVFQARLSRHRLVHRWVRIGFLCFTVGWLGYTVGAQLSIVHVINYLQAPFQHTDLGFYLAEPLIVVLGVYVLISMVLIGRGVFCGWLCPFGAMQELTHKVGRLLHLPEINPPPHIQKWMWLPKYVIAAIIIVTAFVAPQASAVAQEAEPFKTAITSVFSRPWPYVAYASFLLVVSLFSERAFCRFFCPLGAVLATLDRLHLVNLLKRRPECGTPCHLCERSCPVKAIMPSGKIITSECFQCLDCQVEYYDDHRCPPLSKERKKRERSLGKTTPTTVPGRTIGQPIPAVARQAGNA